MNGPIGPVETIERIGQEISWLNDELHFEVEQENVEQVFPPLISDVEKDHPLMNYQVRVHGRQLELTKNEDDSLQPFTVLPEDLSASKGPVEGKYGGYCIRPVYLPEHDYTLHSIVHVVETGQLSYPDAEGNQHNVTKLRYVMAEGSRLEPKLPIGAHHLGDMSGSRVVEQFDEILFDEELEAEEQIRQIGRCANEMFRSEEHLIDVQYQRVSYLNASGLLDGVFVETSDFMIVSDRDRYVDGTGMPKIADDAHSSVSVGALSFDVLPSYEQSGAKSFKLRQPPELFLAAQIPAGWLALPVKSLDKIKKRG